MYVSQVILYVRHKNMYVEVKINVSESENTCICLTVE